MKEAAARIKINKLLEAAGWRFFADEAGPASIQLEPSVTIQSADLDKLGQNYEKAKKGFADFLLLNEKGFPFIVLEAKSEDKNPLVGKEQARGYARSQRCRFVILSNGNLHYFWDIEHGNPEVIATFPSPASVAGCQKIVPMPAALASEDVGADYVVLTQRAQHANEAGWKNEAERPRCCEVHGLRFLRPYQLRAIHAVQKEAGKGKHRSKFLADVKPGEEEADAIPALKTFFKAHATSESIRRIIEAREFGDLATHPAFSIADFKAVQKKFRELVPQYIRDYVSVNQFVA